MPRRGRCMSRASAIGCAMVTAGDSRSLAARIRWCVARSRQPRRIDVGACDTRVSAARADVGAPLSLLFCFSAELRSARGMDIQRMIAVLVPVSGAAVEIPRAEQWLRLADNDREIPAAGLWCDLFAGWAACRQADAEAVARAVLQRMAVAFAATRRDAIDREASELERWLRLRADDICGAFVPRTADLFGAVPADPDWQLLAAPLDRLAAFAADGGNPSGRRREADSVVSLFRRRVGEGEACAACLAADAASSRNAHAGTAWLQRVTLELSDCVLFGPALPEPFVHFELEARAGEVGLAVQGAGQTLRTSLGRAASPASPSRRFGWTAARLQSCHRAARALSGLRRAVCARTRCRRARAWKTAAG